MQNKSQNKDGTDGFEQGRSSREVAYEWIMTVRLIGLLMFGAAIFLFWRFGQLDFSPQPVLLILLGLILLSTGAFIALKKWRLYEGSSLYILLLLDIIGVTAIVHFSGGSESPYPFLYLIPLVSATLFSLRATITMGVTSLVCYSALLYLEGSGVVSAVPLTALEADYRGAAVRLARFVLLSSIIVVQSYYFISRIRKRDEEITKLKEQFLFRTIHGLRSPTTSIRWLLERFSMPDFLKANLKIAQEIGYLQKLNERMIHMVDDLTAIARGEQVDVVLKQEKVELRLLLEDLLREFEGQLAEKKVHVEYALSPEVAAVRGDADRLKEVFGNLLDNAIKYNKPGGSITITHGAENGFQKTVIQDTGVGIAPQYMAKLFTPYFRADAEREFPGTGLGLYIAKQFLERMGGNIEVDSELAQGTKFTVVLKKYT